jgi:hypothetical protein
MDLQNFSGPGLMGHNGASRFSLFEGCSYCAFPICSVSILKTRVHSEQNLGETSKNPAREILGDLPRPTWCRGPCLDQLDFGFSYSAATCQKVHTVACESLASTTSYSNCSGNGGQGMQTGANMSKREAPSTCSSC